MVADTQQSSAHTAHFNSAVYKRMGQRKNRENRENQEDRGDGQKAIHPHGSDRRRSRDVKASMSSGASKARLRLPTLT